MFGKIRWCYSIASLVIIWISVVKYESFFPKQENITIDSLSYIGTIATVIGLLIAVLEVMHSVNVSKQIKDEASKILERAKEIEKASTTSDCLRYVNDAAKSIEQDNFEMALVTFRFFRTLNLRLNLNYFPYNKSKGLSNVEEDIISLTQTSDDRERDKEWLIKDILQIKTILEEGGSANNPA